MQKWRRERQKSRQEVSCSWPCRRYRSARTHTRTSFTTLRTPPSSTPNSQRQRHSEKCDWAGNGGETFASGGIWSESCNSEVRSGWSEHRKSACLGLSLPGRGQITLVQYCECAPSLHQMENQPWANGYDLVLGLLVMLDVNLGCILAKGISKLTNIILENSPTMFIDMMCHEADDHGSVQSKSWSCWRQSGVS